MQYHQLKQSYAKITALCTLLSDKYVRGKLDIAIEQLNNVVFKSLELVKTIIFNRLGSDVPLHKKASVVDIILSETQAQANNNATPEQEIATPRPGR